MSNSYLTNFLRNSVWSYLSKLVLLVFGFLYVYVVANRLGPSGYGILSYAMDFLGTITILLGFTTLSEILTVFVAKQNAKKLSSILILLGSASALLFSLFIFIFPETVLGFIDGGTVEMVQLVGFAVSLSIVSNLFIGFLSGLKNFGKVLKLGVVENALNFALVCYFLFFQGGGIIEVVYAKIISLALVSALGWNYYSRAVFVEVKVDWKPVKKYASLAVLLNFLNKSSSQLILVFIGLLVDPLKLGLYYLMLKLSTYFFELPINSLNAVLLPTLSAEEHNPSRLHKTVSLNIKFSILLSIIFSAIMLIFGGLFLSIFFPQYAGASSLILFFSVYFSFGFLLAIGAFYRAINRNEVLVKASSLGLILTLLSGYFLIESFGVEGIVLTLILYRAVQTVYFLFDIRRNNYQIQFVPRKGDLIFFINTLKDISKNIVNKLFRSRPAKK